MAAGVGSTIVLLSAAKLRRFRLPKAVVESAKISSYGYCSMPNLIDSVYDNVS